MLGVPAQGNAANSTQVPHVLPRDSKVAFVLPFHTAEEAGSHPCPKVDGVLCDQAQQPVWLVHIWKVTLSKAFLPRGIAREE